MRAVEVGHTVVGIEIDEQRAKRLLAGGSYVEDITSEQLQAALRSSRYTPASDYRATTNFDVAVITVPTPLREGAPDLSYIERSAGDLSRFLRPGATVILESTTYPGTTEELVAPILEEGSGLVAGSDFHLGYSPERIDPGNPTWTFVNTPKVVSGIDAASLAAVQGFYDTVVDTTVPVSSPKEAELTKLLENTFRHVNIALVNELAMFAADLGIDVWEAIDAASTKPFGFMRFTPGPGVGGHCLPIDPSYLSWRVKRSLGQSFRFVELANDVNDHMPDYVVRRLTVALNRQRKSVNGSRILLLGLAYKANTGDAREAPSRAIAEQLLGLGAEVKSRRPSCEGEHRRRANRRRRSDSKSWRPPTPSCSSPITPPSTTTPPPPTPAASSIPDIVSQRPTTSSISSPIRTAAVTFGSRRIGSVCRGRARVRRPRARVRGRTTDLDLVARACQRSPGCALPGLRAARSAPG